MLFLLEEIRKLQLAIFSHYYIELVRILMKEMIINADIEVSCSTKNTGFCKYFIAYFELFYNILPLYILSCILGIRKSTDFIKMRRYYTILDLSYGERETVYSG
uniref:Uncharacterized protein n=1 Tax=Ascaris lumbricoides TaxID=6252 RepID=A0A0M3IH01_ASCLU